MQSQILQSVITGRAVVEFACWNMADALGAACPNGPPTSRIPDMEVAGAFVTLKRDDELRACFGNFGGRQSLREAVRQAAMGAVTRDTRFPDFSPGELSALSVDVTILFNYEPVEGPSWARPQAIEIGRHGLVIQLGSHSGLLLPQVAAERSWDAQTFLDSVCRKAGLPDRSWEDDESRLFRFEGVIVPGRFSAGALHPHFRPQRAIRASAVAGSFYPGTAEEIEYAIQRLFSRTFVPRYAASGLMVPHAGWFYSGPIAARTWASVEIPSTVLVIGPKHTRPGKNLAVMPDDRWQWPGGSCETNRELADRLVDQIPGLEYDADAHRDEHGIEVELPLLHHVAPDTQVVGIVVGYCDLAECLALGNALAEVLKEMPEPVLIVTSSDMNHFADEAENRRLDAIALEALETLDPETLYRTVVDEYRISMCGVRPATIMLTALKKLGRLEHCEQVGYGTSADASGDRSRVVGYAGYWFR